MLHEQKYRWVDFFFEHCFVQYILILQLPLRLGSLFQEQQWEQLLNSKSDIHDHEHVEPSRVRCISEKSSEIEVADRYFSMPSESRACQPLQRMLAALEEKELV